MWAGPNFAARFARPPLLEILDPPLHPVRKSKFLEVWSKLTPSVAVMKPASDLCTVSTVSQTATSTAVSRGKRKCSQCIKVGHTKRTCKGLNKS